MDKWVVDAGPFIHLDQIGLLRLLKHLPRLIVPQSVLHEIGQASLSAELTAVVRWPNLTVRAERRPPLRALEALGKHRALDRGELDCLHLALRLRPRVFLTDDLAARRVAERLRLEVHGTVGLIAYAVRSQWLSVAHAEDALKALYHRSSLFITYAIIERAIRYLQDAR